MEDIESDKERADTKNDNEKDIGTTIPKKGTKNNKESDRKVEE